MFMVPAIIGKLTGCFKAADRMPKATTAEQLMCIYDYPSKLTYLGTETDQRSNHALARIQIQNTITGDARVVRMNAPQLGEVMRTYNEACAFDHDNLKVLQKAANDVQPLDSSLHKPKAATFPNPHGFL